jgi:tetratricopeptide (TPR) repeat protein
MRGRAYAITKDAKQAESDLIFALEWTGDSRTRDSILLATAQNSENNFKNDEKAINTYRAIVEGRKNIGSADEFTALQGIARIQTRKGQFDEALKTLERADPQNLKGVWKENIQKSIDALKEARKSR